MDVILWSNCVLLQLCSLPRSLFKSFSELICSFSLYCVLKFPFVLSRCTGFLVTWTVSAHSKQQALAPCIQSRQLCDNHVICWAGGHWPVVCCSRWLFAVCSICINGTLSDRFYHSIPPVTSESRISLNSTDLLLFEAVCLSDPILLLPSLVLQLDRCTNRSQLRLQNVMILRPCPAQAAPPSSRLSQYLV